MTWKLALGTGLLIVAVSVIPSVAAAKGDAAAGKDVYMKKCNMCHGPDGAGKEAIEKMLKVEMKALGSKEVQAVSDADMKKVIDEGKGKMKPVKGLSDAEMANVIAFVRTLAKK
jgi:mono/diheme cytochrome c family protein